MECKGIGHPDTICDALAEEISLALCHHYLERFGRILHHNVDKILLVGGAAQPAFGGGEILQPMELYLAGRATADYGGAAIPVADIAFDSCQRWLRQHLPCLDVERDVRIVPRIRPGSAALVGLFQQRSALANDTSIGCGSAPRTNLEDVVMEVARALNDPDARRACPAIGQDVKIMGIRHHSHISLTIACALIGRYTADLDAYLQHKDRIRELVLNAAGRVTRSSVDAVINHADDPAHGSVYLTVTGTSAEAGDDGEVGRGNRTSGLITPYRAMSTEAAAGKNPLTHVGKLYNVLAAHIAAQLVQHASGVTAADCVLVSAIGRRIDDPIIIDVAVSGSATERLRPTIARIVNDEMQRAPELTDALLTRRIAVF